jgi:prevent-host-death family protein
VRRRRGDSSRRASHLRRVRGQGAPGPARGAAGRRRRRRRAEARHASPRWASNRIQAIFGLPHQSSPAMKYSTQVRPISYLKSHAAEIVREISESREPMLITQNGEAKLVVMDVHSYQEQEETLALLKILAIGHRDIEQGRFRDAADVFADLDKEDRD